MPTITDTAICLRRWDFSETSQTVSLFTREHGVVRGLAKGAKRERGPFSGGLDVLTRGQIVAIIKRGRELATLTEWHLEETFRILRVDLTANRLGLFMADLVHHMLTDQDPHVALFDELVLALRGLGDRGGALGAVLRLQWRLLEETGYRPELGRDVETGDALPAGPGTLAFSPRLGGLVGDTAGPDRWRVRRATIDLLERVDDPEVTRGAPPEALERANRLLACYCRELVGSELPSLRWAFGDRGPVAMPPGTPD